MWYLLLDNEQKCGWVQRDSEFKLNELYEMIRCHSIEVVQLNGVVLTCEDGSLLTNPYVILDEEGKLKGSPVNAMASNLFHMAGRFDLAVGNVIVCDQELLS